MQPVDRRTASAGRDQHNSSPAKMYSPVSQHTQEEERKSLASAAANLEPLSPSAMAMASPSSPSSSSSSRTWSNVLTTSTTHITIASSSSDAVDGSNTNGNNNGIITATSTSSWSTPHRLYHTLSHSLFLHYILLLLFFIYLVMIPLIFVLMYYLEFSQFFTVFALAGFIPFVLYQLIWRRVTDQHPELLRNDINIGATNHLASSSSTSNLHQHPTSHTQSLPFLAHSSRFFRVVSRHWCYEIYQLLLTLLSCSTYLYYTYHLSYTLNTQTGRGDYSLDSSLNQQHFIQIEYFIIVSLSMDYLLRLCTVQHKLRHIFSLYSFIDICCFTGVGYFSFFHRQLAPEDAVYNYYLFQAPFRFLRMRRALQSLDKPIRDRNVERSNPNAPIGTIYKLGPFIVTKKTAFLILFSLKVLLFIASAAALVLAFEFPCVSVNSMSTRNNSACTTQLQSFHICIYFIIVTLATVGFGDVVVVTDPGRMLMCVIIVYAVIQVPREIQAFTLIEEETRKEEEGKERERKRRREMEANGMTTDEGAPVITSDDDPSFHDIEEIELMRMMQSPENDGDITQHLQTELPLSPPSATSTLQQRTTRSPAVALAPTSNSPLPSSSPSPQVLQHFISDDTAFLSRWATLRIERSLAKRPEMIERMLRCMHNEQEMSGNEEEAHEYDEKEKKQQIAQLIAILFDTNSR